MPVRRRRARPASGEPLDRLSEVVQELRVGEGPGRRLLVLGGTLVPLGLLVILLGWYGASRTSNVYEQIPYLISGGLFGLALVFLGAFLYFGHWLTRLVQEQRARSAAVVDAVDRLAASLDRRATSGSPVGPPPAPTSRPGTPARPGGPRPPAPPGPETQLVATGSGTLAHRPGCRVVAGKPGVHRVTPADGLAPCRLCDPYG